MASENLELGYEGGVLGRGEGESDEGKGSWILEISGRLGDGLKRFRAEQIRRKIVQGR